MTAHSPRNLDKHKASCNYAVGLSEKFIALASAGIALIVALVAASGLPDTLPAWSLQAALAAFGISVILGWMFLMNVISDINRNDSWEISGGPARWLSFLQIIACLGGLALLGAYSYGAIGRSSNKVGADWRRLAAGITEGISGLALVEVDSARTMLLAIHDNKREHEKRLSLVERQHGERLGWTDVEWISALPAPDNKPPIDLEAISRIPGTKEEFIAVSSAGRLYRFRFQRENREATLLQAADLPPAARPPEIESFDLQMLGGTLFAIWAGRGSAEKTPSALHWGEFSREALTIANPGKAEVRAIWPTIHARHLSDLRATPEGAIFGVATCDPGDDGPFASALYLLGHLSVGEQGRTFVAAGNSTRMYVTQRHKIEALELIPGENGGVVFGADDENAGGAICFSAN